MRIGLVLDGAVIDRGGCALREVATTAEALGLDLLWLVQDDRMPDPLVAATVAGAVTTGLRIGVEVALGDAHPVVVAEQAAVCDLALGGRLVLGVRAGPAAGADFAEAVGLVVRSHRPRPFRGEGPRWPTPAGLDANAFMRERTIRVTPAPAQVEPPTWVRGDLAVAARFGLSPVLEGLDEGSATWDPIDAALGDAALRRSRPAVLDLPLDCDRLDHVAAVDALVAARDGWGMDTALVRLPADLPTADRDRLWGDLARVVSPRVQQERIPEGLVAWWDEELLR